MEEGGIQPGFRILSEPRFATPAEFAADPGETGELLWVELRQLVIDESYQREVGTRGKRTIRAIVENFDWSCFDPLMIAPAVGMPGYYAIVDGQHRATAALIHPRVNAVPAYLHQLDRRAQAQAFRDVNHVVTKMTPMQLHAAAVAAGDEVATQIEAIAGGAGVIILRHPKSAWSIQPGETMAIGALIAIVKQHGPVTLQRAMSAIMGAWGDMPGVKALHFKAAASLAVARADLDLEALTECLATMPGEELLDAASSRAKLRGGSNIAAASAILTDAAMDRFPCQVPRPTERPAATTAGGEADESSPAPMPASDAALPEFDAAEIDLVRIGIGEGLTDSELLDLVEEECGVARNLAWLDQARERVS